MKPIIIFHDSKLYCIKKLSERYTIIPCSLSDIKSCIVSNSIYVLPDNYTIIDFDSDEIPFGEIYNDRNYDVLISVIDETPYLCSDEDDCCSIPVILEKII